MCTDFLLCLQSYSCCCEYLAHPCAHSMHLTSLWPSGPALWCLAPPASDHKLCLYHHCCPYQPSHRCLTLSRHLPDLLTHLPGPLTCPLDIHGFQLYQFTFLCLQGTHVVSCHHLGSRMGLPAVCRHVACGWAYLWCVDWLRADGLKELTHQPQMYCVCVEKFEHYSNTEKFELFGTIWHCLNSFSTVFEQHTTQVVSPTEVFEHCLNIFAPMD